MTAALSLLAIASLLALSAVYFTCWLIRFMVGLFLDHPMVILRAEPEDAPPTEPLRAEREPDVHFLSRDGVRLRGWLIRSLQPTRKVIVFFHEYGASGSAWSRYLLSFPEAGYHVFTFDFRGCGASETTRDFRVHKWATEVEVGDADAALCYIRDRASHEGWEVHGFGASKGASAMFMAAPSHPWLRSLACEGMSSTLGTIFAYMRRWARIYIPEKLVERMPDFFLRMVAHLIVVDSQIREASTFPDLESRMAGLQDRRALFIYGERDSLISSQHRQGILSAFPGPNQVWIVPRAGHLAGSRKQATEFRRRLLQWFDASPGPVPPPPVRLTEDFTCQGTRTAFRQKPIPRTFPAVSPQPPKEESPRLPPPGYGSVEP